MVLGRKGELMVGWAELPRLPGYVLYDRPQAVLIAAGFDSFAEEACRPCYASRGEAVAAAGPLLPHAPGRLLQKDRQRAWPRMAMRR